MALRLTIGFLWALIVLVPVSFVNGPALADGYGYDEPSYQPRYSRPAYKRCSYRQDEVYDPVLGRYVVRRVRVCE